jgi:putative restriction endonuclease
MGVVGVHPARLLVRVRGDVLRQIDGPMLRHGLQALEGVRIETPRAARHRPDPEHLQWKWERFERAS